MISEDIDLYIESHPELIREKLNKIRGLGFSLIPGVTEVMGYGVPAFKTKKIIFNYAAFKKHIGIYPGPEVIDAMRDELNNYKTTKGAIQFLHSEELPIDLIKELIKKAVEINDL